MFPPLFLERLSQLGLDTSLYTINPRKSLYILKNKHEIVEKYQLQAVPWCERCYWGKGLTEIARSHYNEVFMQDPCSVVPVLAMGVKKGDTVVDLCAAPGSKTLHLARLAGQVIACDSHRQRIKRIYHNLDRFSIEGCRVIRCDGRNLLLRELVDRVLVDAPCSGEGMVKKVHKGMKIWSLNRIKRLARLQKKLVLRGLKVLKEGGVLVYSTCTFAPEENEGVIQSVLEQSTVSVEKISLHGLISTSGVESWQGTSFHSSLENTIRIYPFHNTTNGFFIATLRKTGE